MAGSRTSWDAARRTVTVCLESAIPEDVDLEADLRRLHNVVRVEFAEREVSAELTEHVVIVVLHNEQDISAVEECLRRRGLIQTSRWEGGNS